MNIRNLISALSFIFLSFLCPIDNRIDRVSSNGLKYATNSISPAPSASLVDLNLDDYTLKKLNPTDEINQLVISTSTKQKPTFIEFNQLRNILHFTPSDDSLVTPSQSTSLIFNLSASMSSGDDSYIYDLCLSLYKTRNLAIGWSRRFTYNGSPKEYTTDFFCNYTSLLYFSSFTCVSDFEYIYLPSENLYSKSESTISYTSFIFFTQPVKIIDNAFLTAYNGLDEPSLYIAEGPSLAYYRESPDNPDNPSFSDGYNKGFSDGLANTNNNLADKVGDLIDSNKDLTDSNKELEGQVNTITKEYHDYQEKYNDITIEQHEKVAYQEGYNNGLNAVTNDTASLTSLFGAIASIPLTVLNGLSAFTIWNTPVIYLIMTFVFIGLAVFVIRKLI